MKIYKNGDRCPCCGQLIEGKSEEWLNDFSMLVLLLGLPDVCPGESGIDVTFAPDRVLLSE